MHPENLMTILFLSPEPHGITTKKSYHSFGRFLDEGRKETKK
jgi:hypothetical protein